MVTDANKTTYWHTRIASMDERRFCTDWRALWYFRELLFFLTWRNIKVRYKQTGIGVAWALIQPIAMMAVFTLFFGKLAKMPSDGVPYAIFALAGLIPWQVFTRALTESSTSLVTDQRLVTKVYFPKALVPAAVCGAALVDFLITLVLLFAVMAWYGVAPKPQLIFLPAFILLMMMAAMGIGFWLSALNVEYRDVAYTIPFLTQFWMFATPVVYPSSLVPEQWQLLYGLNPMAGVVEGFRWCIFGTGGLPSLFWVSVAITVFAFWSGLEWFSRRELTLADFLGGQ